MNKKLKTNKSDDLCKVAGVTITHPDRIFKPMGTITKEEVAVYYDQIKEHIIPFIVNRPLVMYRCPEGQQCFYQKHYAKYFSKDVHKINIRESTKQSEYIMIKNIKGLISLVQFSTLEFHPWGALYSSIEKPDQITLDLDPDPNVSWKEVIKTAFTLRDILEHLDLISFVKTSGGKGLHIVIPIKKRATWDEIKSFAHNIVLYMGHAHPNLYTDNPLKIKRKGKIFIDYLRNGRGATSVCAYSTRAKLDAPISTPITWKELATLKSPHQYNVSNIMKRMNSLKADPWQDFFKIKQPLPKMKVLDQKL